MCEACVKFELIRVSNYGVSLQIEKCKREMSNDKANKSASLTNKSKSNKEETHPCLKEHKASLKCLEEKDGSCQRYFDNYNACMGFWNKVKSMRRRSGITPELPPVEERKAIIKEYYK